MPCDEFLDRPAGAIDPIDEVEQRELDEANKRQALGADLRDGLDHLAQPLRTLLDGAVDRAFGADHRAALPLGDWVATTARAVKKAEADRKVDIELMVLDRDGALVGHADFDAQ